MLTMIDCFYLWIQLKIVNHDWVFCCCCCFLNMYIVFFIYRNKLNWCIELNVSSKIINSLEENEIKYFGPVLGTGFFCIKEIADKWNIIKIKNFGFLNNTDEKLKITHGEKIFVNHASSKNLVSITYIELSKINNKINNNQVKKQKIWTLYQRISMDCNKHMKRCSTSFITGESEIRAMR